MVGSSLHDLGMITGLSLCVNAGGLIVDMEGEVDAVSLVLSFEPRFGRCVCARLSHWRCGGGGWGAGGWGVGGGGGGGAGGVLFSPLPVAFTILVWSPHPVACLEPRRL